MSVCSFVLLFKERKKARKQARKQARKKERKNHQNSKEGPRGRYLSLNFMTQIKTIPILEEKEQTL